MKPKTPDYIDYSTPEACAASCMLRSLYWQYHDVALWGDVNGPPEFRNAVQVIIARTYNDMLDKSGLIGRYIQLSPDDPFSNEKD